MEIFGPLKSNQIEIDQEDINKLSLYVRKLEKWNGIHALTSVSAREIPYVFVVEPILASMSISKLVTPENCLDMGTGFGNPGVAMSMYFKRTDFLLVDSSQKKTALLRQIVQEAKMERIEILTSRIEDISNEKKFDLIVSRGIGPLERTLDYAAEFVKDNGIIAIFKAKLDSTEYALIKNSAIYFDGVINLKVMYPSKEVSRYLLIYRVKNS
ncbi:MAG: 16S rRNA (guanine(527)-N(7))-methyltransferase RsmG [Thermotogae bacterium]|nr:16S rRNA (guanine(527)-N(7))-methyltransferase RsmG [Thermotogota bacterium]MCL5031990.1 16S rRNA (guanine(527)-N(7))-methyltransferase RsmG [Thermotogota bacterium]